MLFCVLFFGKEIYHAIHMYKICIANIFFERKNCNIEGGFRKGEIHEFLIKISLEMVNGKNGVVIEHFWSQAYEKFLRSLVCEAEKNIK